MASYRTKHQTTTDITVYLPPIKSDCTCVTDINRLSILNSPVDYCSDCENLGYIETPQTQIVSGVLVDFISESNPYTGGLRRSDAGEFDVDRYVIHCDQSSCISEYDNSNLAFDDSKKVRINTDEYDILSIDKSILLEQVRVHISRRN